MQTADGDIVAAPGAGLVLLDRKGQGLRRLVTGRARLELEPIEETEL